MIPQQSDSIGSAKASAAASEKTEEAPKEEEKEVSFLKKKTSFDLEL